MPEFHQFEVDKSVVSDFIHSQSGTLSTAIRELIMNFVDANSKVGTIILSKKTFEVSDSGLGFVSREVIDKCFKTFGTPHVDGDAKYGRFRIGRGQCMSLASMCWHSNQFKMKTDVRSNGNGFFLEENEEDFYKGCKVTGQLYTELSEHELEWCIKDIKKFVRFMDEHITLNGVLISQFNHDEWDFENESVKVKFSPKRANGIYIYSQGVFVKSLANYDFGFDADVVTKIPLKLNMARNEISESDPLWSHIVELLRNHSIKLSKEYAKQNRTDELSRQNSIKNFLSGNLKFSDVLKLKLIRDSRNRLLDISQFIMCSKPITEAKNSGCKIADTLATRGIALVLHHDECRIWDIYEPIDLVDIFSTSLISEYRNETDKSKINQANYYLKQLRNLNFVDFDVISKGITLEIEIYKNSDLTLKQRAGRLAVEYASRVLAKKISKISENPKSKRKILIGKSLTSLAWTDGSTYITLNESTLDWLDDGIEGMTSICHVLLHEYLHDVNDTSSHEHNFDFYNEFHHCSVQGIIGTAVTSLNHQYQRELLKLNLPLPSKLKNLPLINIIQEYEGEINKKGLSELSIMFLDAVSASFEVKGRSFKCSISHLSQLENGMFMSILEKLREECKKDGIKLPTWDDVLYKSNLFEQRKLFMTKTIDCLITWADGKGHDSNLIRELDSQIKNSSKPIQYMPSNAALCSSIYKGFEGVLQLICKDKNSGLEYFTTKTLTSVSLIGNEKLLTEVPFSKDSRIRNLAQAVTGDNEEKFEHIAKSIAVLVAGITDQEEKERFIKTYFKDALAVQCI